MAESTCYDRVHLILEEVMSYEAVESWLHRKSPALGGIPPLDLIIDGRCQELLDLCNQVKAQREALKLA